MHGPCRFASSIERGLGAAALVIGRTVTRGLGVLPRLVRRASGLDRPSPEAAIAGILRGVTALAPVTMGTIGGACIELAGAASVLALATWTVRAESDADVYEAALTDAIAHAERRGLCGARAASIWRATAGLAPLDRDLLEREALELPMAAARALSQKAVGRAAKCVRATKVLRVLGIGHTFADAWVAMGEAARLVEAMRCFAAERAASRAPGGVVIRFPSRAA